MKNEVLHQENAIFHTTDCDVVEFTCSAKLFYYGKRYGNYFLNGMIITSVFII